MYKYIYISLLLFFCLSSTVQAHRTKVFAWVEGTAVVGEVYFGGGESANGSKVELVKGKQLVATAYADESGVFRFEEITGADYRIKADAGQGHVATFDISADEFSRINGSPDEPSATQALAFKSSEPYKASRNCEVIIEAALVKAIQPLRNQLDRYEENIRWHDILGGIGYIMGLFGLWSLMRARRR
ncbi:hypothetical protein [uncultured Shewanella sp.]|uniref:hypothetical protein n=1 Tax=Shewanella atlantica TaxID=271099 RepID=UPI0026046D8D|nr:hypothetical protein [uncultured Shewanella sp.]